MLKRSQALARAAGEAVGILAPSLPDAIAAAGTRRVDLTAAQSALDAAVVALEAGHDSQLPDKEIERLEAAVTDARVSVDRCQRSYKAAEKRLTAARAAASERARAAMLVRLNEAKTIREKAAAEIDRLAVAMGEQVRLLHAQDAVLAEAAHEGVAPRETNAVLGRAQRCTELALSKAGAIPRAFMGDITQHPGAADVILRDNGALSAA